MLHNDDADNINCVISGDKEFFMADRVRDRFFHWSLLKKCVHAKSGHGSSDFCNSHQVPCHHLVQKVRVCFELHSNHNQGLRGTQNNS